MPEQIYSKNKFQIIQVDRAIKDKNVLAKVIDTLKNLTEKGSRDFILDFTNLDRMDSKTIGITAEISKYIKLPDSHLYGAIPDDQIKEIFSISNLDSIIQIFRSIEDIFKFNGISETENTVPLSNIFISTKGEHKIISFKDNINSLNYMKECKKTVDSFIKQKNLKIVFDLSNLESIDSNLLGFIAETHLQIENISIISDNKNIIDLFHVVGLYAKLHFYKDEKEFIEFIEKPKETPYKKSIYVISCLSAESNPLEKDINQLGHAVTVLKETKESVNGIITNKPEIVFISADIPQIAGFEICRAVKVNKETHNLPVIFIADPNNHELIRNVIKVGGDGFIKPDFSQEELFLCINTFLRISEQNNKIKELIKSTEKIIEEKSKIISDIERQLYQVEKMSVIGTMLSGIAHELKNPIFIIGTWAKKLIEKGHITADQIKIITYIEEQAEKSAKIVENLLKLTQKKIIDTAIIDINAIIDNIKTTLDFLVKNKTIEIQTDLQSKGTIKGNSSEIEQIIVNLISNSIDAIESKGVVKIRTIDAGEWRLIEVEDNGNGMPEEIQKKIFDPFFTTKGPGKGTGLGMSIVYKIVEVHGGRIKIQSNIGKGTKISVFFPKLI